MTRTDRRRQRTHKSLQNALIELISERDFDTITIQDIADRADVGRTTFYLHYNSKEELFLTCHEAIVSRLQLGLFHPLSREEFLSSETHPGITSAYRHLEKDRGSLYPIFQGKNSQLMLRWIRDRSSLEIEENLRATFKNVDSKVPLDILASYLAGAQIALMQWWLEKRRVYSPNDLAQALHQLQRAVIQSAFPEV